MTKPTFNRMHLHMLMLLTFAMAMIFPDLAFAGAADDLVKELKDDPSAQILNLIFGDVGGLFGNGTTTVFSAMFGVFNAGMMAVGGCLVGYTVLSGTLRTAHEGELLGRQWSSVWIPLRSAVGMAMVLPGPGGYALVQVFMMFCALVGISLGNTVWNAATQFASFGSTQVTIITDSHAVIDTTLEGAACAARLAYNGSTSNPQSVSSADIAAPVVKMVNNTTTVSFGDASGKCGSISVPIGGSGFSQIDDIYTYKASQIVEAFNALTPVMANVLNNQTIAKSDRETVLKAYTIYETNVAAFAKSAYEAAAKNDNFMQMVKTQGWMFAGATWMKTTERINKTHGAVSSAKTKGIDYTFFEPATSTEVKSTVDMASKMKAYESSEKYKGIASATAAGTQEDKLNRLRDSVNLARSDFSVTDLGKNGDSFLSTILSPIPNAIGLFFNWNDSSATGVASDWLPKIFQSLFSGESDPILVFAEMGNILVGIVVSIYVGLGVTISASGALPIVGGVAAPLASWFGAFFNMITMAVGTAGMTFSTYIPFSPAIVWTLAIAGWMVLVVESMIAAPLWAVMHASPEGHEWSGKGAQGYMIVLGLVLRPGLMIFGLVGAMVLMRIFLTFASIMMSIAVVSLDATPGVGGFIGPLGMIFIFCLFTWLCVKLVNRALQMINEIPSSIMKWIGGGHDPLGDDGQHEGKSFVGGVLNRGESAANAALGSMRQAPDKNLKNPLDGGNNAKSPATDKANAEIMGKPIGPGNKDEFQ